MSAKRPLHTILYAFATLHALTLSVACSNDAAPDPGTGDGDGDGGGDGDDSEIPEGDYRLGSPIPTMPTSFDVHRPACDDVLSLGDLSIRLFAEDGHLFYFEVTPEAASAGDRRLCETESPPSDSCPNFATNVRVVPWGASYCADTGKVELDLRGGRNYRPWLYIPTFKFDSGQFSDTEFGDGDSQLRFHSGQGGATILREAIALRVFRALGYPAPNSSFVKTQSNVWDTAFEPGTWAAHLLLQAYKKEFFDDEMPDVGSVWEGKGDLLGEGLTESECEWSLEEECNDAGLSDVVAQIQAEEPGEGFAERTAALVDWPSVHAFQCLSAMTGTPDDWVHSGRHVVVALTTTGSLRYLPHRMDRSADHYDEGDTVPSYDGEAYLVQMCKDDPACKAAALNTCNSMLDAFVEQDLVTNVVDERCDTLERLGLDRPGDEAACDEIHTFYAGAVERVRAELE